MSRVYDIMKRRMERAMELQADVYAVASLEAAVAAGPGPEKTDTATGRARASIRTSTNEPANFDPGPNKATYKAPSRRVARFGIKGRRPDDAVVLSMGVPYQPQVEDKHGYHAVEIGGRAGEEALKAQAASIARRARRVK